MLSLDLLKNSLYLQSLKAKKVLKMSKMPSWRNGRRAGLKHLWETVPVRVRRWVRISTKGQCVALTFFVLERPSSLLE
jgi:hypothetical protein